jgi:hypothetical protein
MIKRSETYCLLEESGWIVAGSLALGESGGESVPVGVCEDLFGVFGHDHAYVLFIAAWPLTRQGPQLGGRGCAGVRGRSGCGRAGRL